MKGLARLLNTHRRRIIGVFAGMSGDGADAALVEVESLTHRRERPLSWELVDHLRLPFGEAVRDELLAVQEGCSHQAGRITRLHFVLGGLFADAAEAVARDAGAPLESIDAVALDALTLGQFPAIPPESGPHGHTLPGSEAWGRPAPDGAGWVSPSILQLGEPAVIAERTGLPVLSGFRARDVAAGGMGTPLSPLIDHHLFADPDRSRLVLGLGSAARLTALRAGAEPQETISVDVGPCAMLIDDLVALLTGGERHDDRGGALARRGSPDRELVERFLGEPFFKQVPPRVAGRAVFGTAFARRFLEAGRERKLSDASLLATAVLFIARAALLADTLFVRPHVPAEEIVVAGHGAHNIALLETLARLFPDHKVVTSDYYGLDMDARDATEVALLGHLSLEGQVGNVVGATGARMPVVLGTLTPGGGG